MKQDLKNREDVEKLITSFYSKIKEDETLGPIFNTMINNWDEHVELLTTFWEHSLFMTKKLTKRYQGNPIDAHIKVDKFCKHQLNEMHFGIWLNYWSQTLDTYFEGEITELAKRRARKMATLIHVELFKAREKPSTDLT